MFALVHSTRFLHVGNDHDESGITVPTTESPAALETMHPITHQLAVKRASLDGEPRIVAHSGTISIVTPSGEVWQVFDSEGPGGQMRPCPLSDNRVAARIFVRTDSSNAVRIYRFGLDESRSTSPLPLLAQLERALSGDDIAA